jgi:DNA repair photolyase
MALELGWDYDDSWFDREYVVQYEDDVVTELGESQTLDRLRKVDRQHGSPTERLDLWQSGLLCSDCTSEINNRFAATPNGDLLCWECATKAQQQTENGLVVNTDPTQSVMSESYLHTKGLCDHVINVATGCRHGCEFCYVPTTPAIENRQDMLNEQASVDDPQENWGNYLLYRDDLPERVRRMLESTDTEDRKQTRRGRGIVMLSSGTDCYQDRRTAQITRGVVTELIRNNIPVRILTRSPAVVRDIDLFKVAGSNITVGSSIPSFDTQLVRAIEPGAPPPMKRWEALDQIQRAGVPVYVSMSPTYPTMDEDDFFELLSYFRALGEVVVFHEPINPRGANFQLCLEAAKEAGYTEIVDELQQMQEDYEYWVSYALEQFKMVQEVATHFEGLHIHQWPDDELLKATGGETQRQLQAKQQAVPPENLSTTQKEQMNKSQLG